MSVQSNTLLLVDVMKYLRNMCIKKYKLDPACFLTATGLAWQVAKVTTTDSFQIKEKITDEISNNGP